MDDDLDLEEELLQVAGRSRQTGNKRSRSRRAPSDSEDEAALDSGDDSQEQPGRKKQATVPLKKRAAASREDEAGSDDGSEAFDDGYGSDLMGDAADRQRLMAMNELEREMILADRAEARDRERERRRNAKLIQARQTEPEQLPPDQMRSSTRSKKPDTAKKSAMAELVAAKQARDRKTRTAQKKQKGRRARDDEDAWSEEESFSESEDEEDVAVPPPPPSDEADEEAAARSSDEDDRQRSRFEADADRFQDEEEEFEEATFDEVRTIQVKRYKLEKWVNEPYFERTMPGCMVRVAVPVSGAHGQSSYVLAEVREVVHREPGQYRDLGRAAVSPYPFGEGGARTHKWLVVRRGYNERTMPMSLVSNSNVMEEEFEQWCKQCMREKRRQLTRIDVDKVKQALKTAESYVYTAEDVARMLNEKRAKGAGPRNVAAEKANLQRLRDYAQENNNEEELERIEQQLAELEVRIGEERNASRRGGMSDVNKRNARVNFQNALNNISARAETEKVSASGIDLFSRRKTRSSIYWRTKKDAEGEPQSAADLARQAVEDAQANGEEVSNADLVAAGLPAMGAATATRNDAGEIDLDIDLSVLDAVPRASMLAKQLLGPRWQLSATRFSTVVDLSKKKTLTLTDYKRRQGIA
ncbi:hypothetical protein WJX72_008658 [[Myrmecia] bisecta]|uniref:Plus3 domain-containing protein n=1 Tax=[Myrmecia] bisecta TaxID=41462 RepID=A0AAW1PJM4_9CHLO